MKKIALVALVLSIIYSVFHPWVNNNPVKLVKIQGRFPFDKGYKLTFSISAHTTSMLARFFCGGFGFINGATGIDCLGGRMVVEPTIVDCFSYEFNYYDDYYSPGVLSWVASPTYYRVHSGDFSNVWGGTGLPQGASKINCSKEVIDNGAKYFVCAAEKSSLNIADAVRSIKIDFDVLDKTQLNR